MPTSSISTRLNNEYLISVANGIADCAEHVLEVTVIGEDGQRAIHSPCLRYGTECVQLCGTNRD